MWNTPGAAVTVPVMVTGGFRTASGIEKAVATGAADLVGLARALVLEPNLPNKLAVGAFTAVAIPHFSTGSAKLDAKVGSLIGLAYYEQQMRRLGRHQSVKRPKTAWPILMYAMRYQGLAALVPGRKPPGYGWERRPNLLPSCKLQVGRLIMLVPGVAMSQLIRVV